MRFLLIVPLLSSLSAGAQLNIARDLVNPFVGTGGHGHTFPGACVPNGLVQLGPDTRPDGYNDWDGCGGYHYSDSVIYGFSHTHLSGTGVADLCDVLLMPRSGKLSLDPVEYRSRFSHASESANTGYYRVHLNDANVDVELSSTARVGVHRYRFPAEEAGWVVLDLAHRDKLLAQQIEVVGDRSVQGSRRSTSWARDQQLFYVIEFSRPFSMHRVDPLMSELGDVDTRSTTKAGFRFEPSSEPLIVKVGISAVSIEGARANLDAEVPHWDFDLVRKQAEAAWNTKLNKIRVKGGKKEEQRIFYTALYHSYVAPYIFNDVDGKYRGMDGEVHQADHNVYTVFSLWDTFRALHPLMTVLEPEMTSDWIKTFLLHYQQGGRLPVWELWGNETDCMIGYHSVSVIADAYSKGIRGFDTDLALRAMVAGAEQDHFGLKAYRERGYISSEDEPESVSRTLEYAYDDWCIARFAEAIGKTDVAERFHARSRNWQNLFDPNTKFFRARRNGGFVEPFDPYEVNFHFTEANAWQYGFFVPHDMERYTQLVGGKDGLGRKLDALFNANERTTGRDQSDITGLIGQYAHGNEPSHGFAYLGNLSDRPMMTDARVLRIMRELYHDAPDGLTGNEDCGQMSAWYVWSAMGLYPLCPGSPEYTTGIPLFDEVTMDLGPGRTTRITTTLAGTERAHVEAVKWNNHELTAFRMVPHDALVMGGELHFDLGPEPGSVPTPGEDDVASPGALPAPIIQARSVTFSDSLVVTATSVEGPWSVAMSVNYDADPLLHGEVAGTSLVLHQSGTIAAHVVDRIGNRGPMVTAKFIKVEGVRNITLESNYANQYSAGGNNALVDGLRGGSDFRSGEWQGYQGQDVIATIDLGRLMKLKRAGLSALQDQKSWIWLPKEVVIATSTNQRQWSTTTITHDVDRQTEGTFTKELWTPELRRKARYLKIIAKNAGPCPEWHPSKGGSTWIFSDEVLIELE
ncbi:MAG: GH92 family glycosyl hydrolase [Flavobacteriales bacterium]|nr:GH92 family glycosyl hydrolase [Flavobacteriales bacterium]